MASLGHDPAEDTAGTHPAGVGNQAAAAVLLHRADDGANQAGNYADTTGYRPVNTPDRVIDPWRWQPVRVPSGDPSATPQTAATPQWGQVRPFDPNLPGAAIQVPNPFQLSTAEKSAMIEEIVRRESRSWTTARR